MDNMGSGLRNDLLGQYRTGRETASLVDTGQTEKVRKGGKAGTSTEHRIGAG